MSFIKHLGKRATQEKKFTSGEVRLIVIECLQWCAMTAVYYLGLIGIATYDLGGDAFLVAAVTLAHNLMTSIGNAVSGPVIDCIGPRRTMLGSLGLSMVASLAMWIIPTNVASVMFAAVFLGLTGGFINTCTHTFPAYLVDTPDRRQRLNGHLVLYGNVAFMIGPIIGGMLMGYFPTKVVYLLLSVCMGMAFAVALRCREVFVPEHGKSIGRSHVASGMVDGARIVFHDRKLRVVFLSGFLGFFAFGAFDSLESLFYRDVLRVDIAWLGYLSSVVGLTSAIGSYMLTKMPTERLSIRLLLQSLFLVGVGSIVYVATDQLWVAIVGQLINGFAWGYLEPLQMILTQENTPLTHVGRVTGFVRFGLMSAGVVPLLAAPFLSSALGVQPVLLGASCIVALVGMAFLMNWRDDSEHG